MFRFFLLILITFLSNCTANSQVQLSEQASLPPKLVVVISVDQMRAEFLDRFESLFGDDGFKRLVNDGYQFRNAHYSFMPTATGPGHSAIYSGAVPAVSGIIGNGWYDRPSKTSINVVSGMPKYHSVGVDSSRRTGQAGPDRLLVTTVADELKKASQFQSKVYAIAIKDRSAIMGAGHRGDVGLWFDASKGKFITSSYYTDKLPKFAEDFNNNGAIQKFNNGVWDLSFPASSYDMSRADNNPYERNEKGDEGPVFPYDLKLSNANGSTYWQMLYTPFANDMIGALAKECIQKENLGKGKYTDFLAINFSSTDYVGHGFGPYSVEIADMYAKLDKTIADIINQLDSSVGKGKYVIALTADHGAVASPAYLRDNKLPGRPYNPSGLRSRLNDHVNTTMGIDTIIEQADGFQIYLRKDKIPSGKYQAVIQEIQSFLESEESVHTVITKEALQSGSASGNKLMALMQNGFYAKRSGDLFYITNPGWLGLTGAYATGHGTPFSYDTHVPIVFYGANVPKGSSVRKVHVVDIAPTISMMTRVMLPSGSTSEVLLELFK